MKQYDRIYSIAWWIWRKRLYRTGLTLPFVTKVYSEVLRVPFDEKCLELVLKDFAEDETFAPRIDYCCTIQRPVLCHVLEKTEVESYEVAVGIEFVKQDNCLLSFYLSGIMTEQTQEHVKNFINDARLAIRDGFFSAGRNCWLNTMGGQEQYAIGLVKKEVDRLKQTGEMKLP